MWAASGEAGGSFSCSPARATSSSSTTPPLHTDNIITVDGEPLTPLRYNDNIAPHNAYGIIGTAHGRRPADDHHVLSRRYHQEEPDRRRQSPASTRRTISSPRRSTRSASSIARAATTVWPPRAASAGPAADGRDPGVDVDRLAPQCRGRDLLAGTCQTQITLGVPHAGTSFRDRRCPILMPDDCASCGSRS